MLKFNDVENHLFYAVIYGLMYYKTDKANIKKEDAQKVLGDDLYFDLLEIEPETLLDKSLVGHFERCYAINQMLAKYSHFLIFFERRDLFRYLTKKKVTGKNEVTINLSACIIRKFN